MLRSHGWAAIAMLFGLLAGPSPARAQVEPLTRAPVKCLADSPERQGLEGCSILAARPLAAPADAVLYWHIDRYASFEAAKAAAGPDSVAAEAHGIAWLMTVEPRQVRPHDGHMAWIGPLPLTAGQPYIMRVQSTFLLPGGGTPVHTHSGPEVFYIVSGAQCVETETVAHRLDTGQSLVLPADAVHRGRVLGAVPRAGLALVVHDANRPPSTDLAAPPGLASCR